MDRVRKPFSFLGALGFFQQMSRGSGNLWDNARFILADVPLHPGEARRVLPHGLKPCDPPTATLFIVDYTQTSFTAPYHEAALLVHVRHRLGRGLHCPWMIVDDDTAMIYGRELLGYPKKMGAFTFAEGGGAVRASLTRRGVTVLAMEGTLGDRHPSPDPVFDVKTFNVGGPGGMFLLNPLWMFRAREVVRESYDLELNVTVAPSAWDPVADLVAGPPVRARFVVLDIVGSRYMLPVGVSGPAHMAGNFHMRLR